MAGTVEAVSEFVGQPAHRGHPWLAVHDHLGKKYFDWRFNNARRAYIREEFTNRLVCFVQCLINSNAYKCHHSVIGGGKSLESVNEIDLQKKCEAFGKVSIIDSALAPEWKGMPYLDLVPHFGLLV